MVLYYLLMFFIALFVVKGIYNWLHAIILRIALYSKLHKVCKKRGYEIEKPRFIFASFFLYSSKPDIIIRSDSTEYLIRIITCRARKRIYHFVNHEWFVRLYRLYILLPFLMEDIALFKRAKHLPLLDEKYIQERGRKKLVVLLFNPSPLEITYTTRTNRREIGTNGTNFDGWVIYNGKAFAQALDNAWVENK